MLRRALVLATVLAAASCSKSSEPRGEARSAAPTAETSAPTMETKQAKGATPSGGEPGPAQNTDDGSYKLALEQPAAVTPGAAATARVTITPGPGYKMNKDFPTKLTLEPPAGVTVDKATFALSDAESFDEHKLVFAVKATPASAGDFTIPAKIKFAVCTDATCDPKRREVSIRVAAK